MPVPRRRSTETPSDEGDAAGKLEPGERSMLLGLVRRIDERRKAHVRLFPAGSRAHVTLSSLVQGRMANLSTAGLTDEDVPALTVVLRRNTNLAWLNLDHNRLTDMGLARLLHPLLEGAPALEALNLGYTLLTAVGLELLAPVLVRKRTLQLVGLARVAGIHRNEPHPTLRWSRSWRHFAVEILDELEPADPRGEVGIRRHESTPLAIFQGESESLIPRGEFAFYCACVHLARGEVPSAGAVLTGAVLTLQEPLDDIAFLLSATYAVDRPTACLLGIYIAQLCDARAGAIRNVTPVDARKFDEVSSSTQLAVRALLQLTPDTEALRLLMRDDMWDVSEMAAESNCRVLLASGQLQMAHVNAFFGNFGSFIHRSLPMLGRRWPHMPATSRVKLVVAVLAFLLVHAVLEPLVYLLIIFVPQCEVYFVHPPPWFCTIIDRMACKESWLSNGRPLVLRMWAVDPFVRFGASWVLDMLLAGLIMSLPPPDRTDMWSIDALWRYVHGQRDQETWQLALKQMPPGSMVLALVWVPAALLGEFTQLLALGFTKEPALALHRYLIEVWNWFDVCGLVTALVGLLLYTAVAMGEAPTGGAMRWAEAQSTAGEAELDPFEDQVRTVQATLAMATWLLWIRALRVTYLVPELGPLMRMVFLMTRDVAVLITFGIGFTWAAAASFHVAFKGTPAVDEADGCHDTILSTFSSPTPTEPLIALIEVWLGGESSALPCLRASPLRYGAWAMGLAYTVITVVLLLNMLIAQMAKTFDIVYEARALSFLHSRAQIMQRARVAPFAPPPINLLGVPARLVGALLYKLGLTHYKLTVVRAALAQPAARFRPLEERGAEPQHGPRLISSNTAAFSTSLTMDGEWQTWRSDPLLQQLPADAELKPNGGTATANGGVARQHGVELSPSAPSPGSPGASVKEAAARGPLSPTMLTDHYSIRHGDDGHGNGNVDPAARTPPPPLRVSVSALRAPNPALEARLRALDESVVLVLEHVEAELDDVSAEDRWRVSMLNRIRGWFAALDEKLTTRVTEVNDAHARTNSEIAEQLLRLERAQARIIAMLEGSQSRTLSEPITARDRSGRGTAGGPSTTESAASAPAAGATTVASETVARAGPSAHPSDSDSGSVARTRS